MSQPLTQVIGTATSGPYLRLPSLTVFEERAARFEALAPNHSLADYLRFLAALSRAQQSAMNSMAAPTLPSAEQQQLCRAHGLPVLGVHGWQRDPSWHGALDHIIAAMEASTPIPTPAREALARLRRAAHHEHERMAETLLMGHPGNAGIDLAAAPFVAAALQVYWSRMAMMLEPDAVARMDKSALCPVCGSPPVASKVRIGPDQGLRYAACSLCLSEWNVVRIKCVHCESTRGITYYGVSPGNDAVKAEWCPECKTYLKIMYMNKDPELEPVADDVATLALDILMSEEGRSRHGLNFFLLTGETTEQEQEIRN